MRAGWIIGTGTAMGLMIWAASRASCKPAVPPTVPTPPIDIPAVKEQAQATATKAPGGSAEATAEKKLAPGCGCSSCKTKKC